MPQLKQLELVGPEVTDQTVCSFDNYTHISLTLNHTEITDKTLDEIAQGRVEFETLDISQNEKITEEGKKRLEYCNSKKKLYAKLIK